MPHTNFFIICIFLFGIFSACSEKITKVAPVEKKSPINVSVKPVEEPAKILTPKNIEDIVSIPKGVDSNLIISISRGGCFGKCAAYSFSVTKDGKAVYEGRAYVSKLGTYVAQVPKPELDNFLLKTQNFASLQSFSDSYPIKGATVTDLPTTKTYIRVGNSGKLIVNNYDAPKEVLDLETRIETFAEGLNWKKIQN